MKIKKTILPWIRCLYILFAPVLINSLFEAGVANPIYIFKLKFIANIFMAIYMIALFFFFKSIKI